MDIVQKNTYSYQTDNKVTLEMKISAIEFEQIFNTYYKRVYKYICYRINNQHMAEDLCSQVFEKVISKYNTFFPEKSSLRVVSNR